MTEKKAIKILNNQIEKFDNIKIYKDEVWIQQTGSYIKEFFGESSVEFQFIKKFNFGFQYYKTDSEAEIDFRRNAKKQNMKQFLIDCTETISHKGLHKEPNKNLVSDKSNFELLTILFTVCVFGFWIGYWAKNIEIFSFLEKTKTEKLRK